MEVQLIPSYPRSYTKKPLPLYNVYSRCSSIEPAGYTAIVIAAVVLSR